MMCNEQDLKLEREQIKKGLAVAHERLIEYKRRIQSPLVISQNGKVVEIDPHDLPSQIEYKRKS